jgi:hypothetical protein
LKSATGPGKVVNVLVIVSVQPLEEFTASVTLKEPALEKIWVGLCELEAGEPSPKSQLHDVIVPALIVELSLKVTGNPEQTGEKLKSATGATSTVID